MEQHDGDDARKDATPVTGRRQVIQGAVLSVTGITGLGWSLPGFVDDVATKFETVANVGGFFTEFAVFNGNVARVFDSNQDGEREVRIERLDAGDGIRITSGGRSTPDYAASLVNLTRRNLTLSQLQSRTRYEYREGQPNNSAVPDEFWIVLQSRSPPGRHAVLRTVVDDSRTGWETRNVATEIQNDGTGQPWKRFSPRTRTLSPIGHDLVERFGADARVQAVGIGRGTPIPGASKIDTLYRSLVVAGESYELPA